ncbi:hypothetical protein [Aestuariivivens insulae]|uniref:hypothetical protein n=1 Tax=Aestuariivivens insulae TaxID=1621988 RepID=UPI001F5AEDFD|nr:hypothetical protein [Aestuariivivens insulae]
MKKALLFFTMLLIGLTAISATNIQDHGISKINNDNYNRYAEPIIFMERGIEFLVFPDGSFDFDTHNYAPFDDDMYYKSNSKRKHVNISYRGPNLSIGYSSNRNKGVYISRDRFGNIRRVGNVFINYDRRGKVTRIGSVFIKYGRGRHATVRQVGGLRVNYNRWGEIVNLRGHVNQNNYCNICGVTSCNVYHELGGHRHDYDDWYNNKYDDDHYYYKKNGKIKKQKRIKR